MSAEARLKELGITLPHAPPPVANYIPAVRAGTLLFPSSIDGMKRLASPPAAWTAYQRTRLDRELVVLPTAYGPITFKASRLGGRPLTVTPEFKEVRRIAREKWLAVREVLEQARADGRQALERWLGS